MMTDTMIEHIRPGASVDTPDGHVGRVERVTQDSIEVAMGDTGRWLSLPRDRVLQVWPDGSIQLSATRAEIEQLIAADSGIAAEETARIQLQEERLVAHKTLEEAGRVRIHKTVEEVPRRLEVDAYYENVEVEHVPIGRIVKEQESPREEHGVYIVPIYEEQLVVVKRLLLREEIHIRRQGATEKRLFEEMVRRERLVTEDPDRTGRVREYYATDRPEGEVAAGDVAPDEVEPERPGLLEKLGRKVLE